MTDCVFCKIVENEIPSFKIYEDENVLSFLDINPGNKGHALVITKSCYETFNDIPHAELAHLISITQMISKAVVRSTKCDGFNIIMNNKRSAGQIVDHVHFHIVPRIENDNVIGAWKHGKYKEGEAETVLEDIRKEL